MKSLYSQRTMTFLKVNLIWGVTNTNMEMVWACKKIYGVYDLMIKFIYSWKIRASFKMFMQFVNS